MSDKEKVRRRLLPFMAEGKISEPVFSEQAADDQSTILVATVAAKSGRAPVPPSSARVLESALQKAISDLGSAVRLIVTSPEL
jgi:hypothetical protein